MRRPLKPFVTEYKGSARRSTGLREATFAETPKSASKPLDFAFPMQVEDSYEAALRAADALFAPQRAVPQDAEPIVRSPVAEIVEPHTTHAVEPAATPERPAGRILRVLDEPPSAEAVALAALEVERAPKRRGRKPGSKNKPKPVDAEAAVPTAVARRATRGPQPAVLLAEALVSAPSLSTDEPRRVPTAPAARRVAALPVDAAPVAVRASKRFSWVKDRLRPGEDWKRRRLPKVCW